MEDQWGTLRMSDRSVGQMLRELHNPLPLQFDELLRQAVRELSADAEVADAQELNTGGAAVAVAALDTCAHSLLLCEGHYCAKSLHVPCRGWSRVNIA